MEWKDAIINVLQAKEAPMHYTEIAEIIAERGLRDELTATPANTVAAIIAMSFKNDGSQSPFLRTARGYYTLRTLQQKQQAPVVEAEELAQAASSETTSVVNAFGMFWDRGKVLWENQPRLLGQQLGGSQEVDFCEQKGVYLLHDSQGVVYVGRTTDQNLGKRLYQHHHGSPDRAMDSLFVVWSLSG